MARLTDGEVREVTAEAEGLIAELAGIRRGGEQDGIAYVSRMRRFDACANRLGKGWGRPDAVALHTLRTRLIAAWAAHLE